ncbi:MAG: NAD(P)-binding domain-containing protein [Pseudomonadota bacterium]
MKAKMKVGFLGTGHIASHMARAVARDGHEVIVSRRSETVSAELVAAELGICVADNHDLVAEADTVFICLRPAVWKDVCGALPWRDDLEVVSVMAGVRMAELEAICAPAEEISATIPLASMEHGGTPLPVLGDPTALSRFFGQKNPILPVADEAVFLKHYAACTMVSGVMGLLGAAGAWLSEQTGEPDTYLGPLAASFLTDLHAHGPVDLRMEAARLASPNTLSRMMMEGLTETGVFDQTPEILNKITQSMETRS